MLSDLENLDIMLGGNNLEKEESESFNFGRRPDSPCYGTSVNLNTKSLTCVKLKLGLVPKMAKV